MCTRKAICGIKAVIPLITRKETQDLRERCVSIIRKAIRTYITALIPSVGSMDVVIARLPIIKAIVNSFQLNRILFSTKQLANK